MHEQWEYRMIWQHSILSTSLRDAEGNEYGPFSVENADEFLNGLGRQGWEVCTIPWLSTPHIVLKRRIAT